MKNDFVNGQWWMGNQDFSFKLINMFLQLNHQKLDLYKASKAFVLDCYKLTIACRWKIWNDNSDQESGFICTPEYCRRGLKEIRSWRKRYFEVSRGSVVEIDAAIDIASELNYLKNIPINLLGEEMVRCFKILTAMINSSTKN